MLIKDLRAEMDSESVSREGSSLTSNLRYSCMPGALRSYCIPPSGTILERHLTSKAL